MATKYAFEPDYLVSPGTTLRETLDALGMSQAELSTRTGLTDKTISQIVNGVAPITYETAERLDLATGVPASFWNRREMSYREAILRLNEAKKLEADESWLSEIPIKDLVKREYVSDSKIVTDLIRGALKFFGVSSVEAWRQTWANPSVQYRGQKVQEKHPGYVAAWLRMGEILAGEIETAPFDPQEFKRSLLAARGLTVKAASTWNAELRNLCASAGVAVVFVREIPKSGVCGATHWLTKDKALIQLSLKYKKDDQLWFTFFHEAGHILLHGKKKWFVEDGMPGNEDEEREANDFARDLLIPPECERQLPHLKSKARISQFARRIGIAPGIVVGRLQRDRLLPFSHCNDLKRTIDWKAS